MENSEYVKVELERYKDLIIAEEQLRTLTSIIFNNSRYSQVANRLTIDEDKAIMAYLESTTHLNQARINHETNKGDK